MSLGGGAVASDDAQDRAHRWQPVVMRVSTENGEVFPRQIDRSGDRMQSSTEDLHRVQNSAMHDADRYPAPISNDNHRADKQSRGEIIYFIFTMVFLVM